MSIYAKKSKKIKKKIFFNYNNEKSIGKVYKGKSEPLLSITFVGNIFYDYHIDKNPKDVQIFINYIDFMSIYLKQAKKLYHLFFKYLFDKILSNIYLPIKIKNKLIKTFEISNQFKPYEYLNISSNLEELFSTQVILNKRNKISIKISIIIVCSNFENISNTIKSISSQNFEYFEIILIFDDYNKKIYRLLKNYIKSYENIRIINNKGKKGYLFSIVQGANAAKGQYLLFLNQYCFFLKKDALKIIYREIKKENGDILEFNLYKILSNNATVLYTCHHFLSQFNLTQMKYNLLFDNVDVYRELLVNKLIKSNYFLHLIENYKLNEIKISIDHYVNDLFNFIINDNSYKFVKTNSTLTNIYIDDKYMDKIKFNDFPLKNKQLLKETIFYISFIFDFSKNNFEAKELVLQEFFIVMSLIFNKFAHISKSSLKLFQKFIDSEYISDKNKNILVFYYYSLIN